MKRKNQYGRKWLEVKKNRSGGFDFYLRRWPKGRCYRLPDPEADQFEDAYNKALRLAENETPAYERKTVNSHRLDWLIDQYLKSAEFTLLRPATRRCYKSWLLKLRAAFGATSFKNLQTTALYDFRENYAKAPKSANRSITAFRALCRWGQSANYISYDPSLGIKALKASTVPYPQWPDECCQLFKDNYPLGCMERLAYELLIDLGARSGDVIRLGPANLQHTPEGRILRFTCQKTDTAVTIPISKTLAAALDATPCDGLAFICSPSTGRPYKSSGSFYNWFRQAYDSIGIKGFSPHGLRKNRTVELVQAGYSDAQVEAKMGWESGSMARHYSRGVDREALGLSLPPIVRENSLSPTPPPHNTDEA